MNLRSFFSNNLYNISILVHKHDSLLSRSQTIFNFLRLTFNYILFNRILGMKNKQVKLFDHEIKYSSYDPLLWMFTEIFVEEQYYFRPETNKPVIIDCGSNVGMSLLYFKLAYPECKITSFEPDKNTYELLVQNVSGNGFKDIKTNQCAVGGTAGEIEFYVDSNQQSAVWMSKFQSASSNKEREMQSMTVNSVVLSDIVAEPVDLLKLDIEGAEFEVIDELNTQSKLALIKQIVIECHIYDKGWISEFSRMLKVLESNGFSCSMTNASGPISSRTSDRWRFMLYAWRP